MLGHEIQNWNASVSTHQDFDVDDLKGRRFQIRAGLQDENYVGLLPKSRVPKQHSGMKSRHLYNYGGWNSSVATESLLAKEQYYKQSRQVGMKNTLSQAELILEK